MLVTTTNLDATEPVLLTSETKSYLIGKHMELFEDPTAKLELKDILEKKHYSEFKQAKKDIPNVSYTDSAIWAKFSIQNQTSNLDTWLFEMNHPFTDTLILYEKDSSNKWHKHIMGDLRPFEEYEYKTPVHTTRLHIPFGQTRQYLLLSKSTNTNQLPVYIRSVKESIAHTVSSQLAQGAYFGITIAMVLYNLFIFFSLKEKVYAYYILYIGLFGLTTFILNGFAFQFLWPNSYMWNQKAFAVIAALTILILILYSLEFLKVKSYNKNLYYLGLVYALIFLSLPLMLLLLGNAFVTTLLTKLVIPIPFYLLGQAIYIYKKGFKPAKYYILAFGVLNIALFSFALTKIGFLPTNIFTTYGLQLGSAAEVILLSIGLANRLNELKEQKEEAQKEIIETNKRLTLSYSRFVPREFLSLLSKNSIEDIALGDAVARNMTVLFSDIRGFTAISEDLLPKENFKFLNRLLHDVAPMVRNNQGFIDKYIGDAMMALFSQSPADAIRAAIEIRLMLVMGNKRRIKKGQVELKMGIGIHTGDLILGIIGEPERMEGTVISDAVNLASRLEGLSKYYQATIITTLSTLQLALVEKNQNDASKSLLTSNLSTTNSPKELPVSNSLNPVQQDTHLHKIPAPFQYREIDIVQVKGKSESVTIIEILDGDEEDSLNLKLNTQELLASALVFYRDSKLDEAYEKFKDILEINPNDGVPKLYLKRIAKYKRRGLPKDWSGVSVMEAK